MNLFKRNVNLYVLLSSLIVMQMSSCLTAGTHGSINSYKYPVKKIVLEEAVNNVISKNPNIQKVDTAQKSFIVDITKGKNDTMRSVHNPAYVDIRISGSTFLNSYTFQYVGSQDDWNRDTTSEISIAYAYDEEDNGGSEGNGDFPWYKSSLKNRLISIFERQFIDKLDKELKVKRGAAKK